MALKDMLKKPWIWVAVIVILFFVLWLAGVIPGLPALV